MDGTKHFRLTWGEFGDQPAESLHRGRSILRHRFGFHGGSRFLVQRLVFFPPAKGVNRASSRDRPQHGGPVSGSTGLKFPMHLEENFLGDIFRVLPMTEHSPRRPKDEFTVIGYKLVPLHGGEAVREKLAKKGVVELSQPNPRSF